MNRYTLAFTGTPTPPVVDQIKAELAGALLLRPATLRFGSAAENAPDGIILELATDAGRDRVLAAARRVEERLGVRLDRIGWGWSLSQSREMSMSRPTDKGTRTIPYAGFAAQSERSRRYRLSRGQVAVALAAPVLLVLLTSLHLFLGWQGISLQHWTRTAIGFLIVIDAFGLVLPNLRLHLVTTMTCDDQGIEMRGLMGRVRRAAWKDIQELEMRASEAIVQAGAVRLHFPTAPPLVVSGIETAVRTLVERASLLYVGPIRGASVFKRSDAP